MTTRPLDTMTREEVAELLRTQGKIPVIISKYGREDRGIIKIVKQEEFFDTDSNYMGYYHVFSSGKILNGFWDNRIKKEAFEGYKAAYAISIPFDSCLIFIHVITNPTLYDLL